MRWLAAVSMLLLLADMAVETLLAGGSYSWVPALATFACTFLGIVAFRRQTGSHSVGVSIIAVSAGLLFLMALLAGTVVGLDGRSGPRALGFNFDQLRSIALIVVLIVSAFSIALRPVHRRVKICATLAALLCASTAVWLFFTGQRGFVFGWNDADGWVIRGLTLSSILMILFALTVSIWSRTKVDVPTERRNTVLHVSLMVFGIALISAAAINPSGREHAHSLATDLAGNPVVTGDFAGDAEAVRRYVMGRVSYEPYQGSLRGAAGTLSSGSGNHLDRSLLLANLLEQEGFETRLRQAASGTDPARVSAQPWTEYPPAGSLRAELLVQTAQMLIWLGDAIFPADRSLDRRPVTPPSSRYIWVQTRDPHEGGWQDLHLIDGLGDIPGVPVDLDNARHVVDFRVLVSVREQDETTTSEILNLSIPTDRNYFPGSFQHRLDGGSVIAELRMADRSVRSMPLPVSAELLKRIESGDFGVSGKAGETIRLFESLPGDDAENVTTNSQGPAVVREVLEITTRGPEQTRKATYVLFDAGRAEADQQTISRGLRSVLGLTLYTGIPGLDDFKALTESIDESDGTDNLARILGLAHLSYLALRDLLPGSVSGRGMRRVINTPNLIITRISDAPQRQAISMDTDLTIRGYQLVSSEPGQFSRHDLFVETMFNGIGDHIVERKVFGGQPDTTVAGLFERVEHDGIDLLTVATATASLPSYLDDQSEQTIENIIRDRATVVLPNALPDEWPEDVYGWWAVSGEYGLTRDWNNLGLHSVSAEQSVQTAEKLTWTERVKRFACVVVMVVGSSGAQIGEAMNTVDPGTGTALVIVNQVASSMSRIGCKTAGRTGPGSGTSAAPGSNVPGVMGRGGRRSWWPRDPQLP